MAWLRGISAAFLPDLAAIERYTETSTAEGVEQGWATIATGIPCRVSPSGANAVERAGIQGPSGGGVVRSLSEWTVWLPALTDVTERDRIVVTGTDRTDGRVFEINRVGERSYESTRECICSLLG